MIYFLAFLFVFPIYCFGATLHAIVAIDTLAFDIENPMEVNLKGWNRFLEVVAKETGMTLNQINLTGQELTVDGFLQIAHTLSVEPDDTLLFYTACHGNRSHNKQSPWPHLGWTMEPYTFDLQWVIDILASKQARFTLILAECCNSFSHIPAALSPQAKSRFREKNYKALFLESEGMIIAASASPGESSWARYDQGSIYTTVFLQLVYQEVERGVGTSWRQIFEQAKLRMAMERSSQHPIFSIFNKS